tara:strand:- start:11179 stop:11394 length:216 start_codon:yes stop_codon:yes gene_type:complete
MYGDYAKKGSTREQLSDLVDECIRTHNEVVLVELIFQLEQDYIDVARLGTMDEYMSNWTHEDVLTHMTFNT